MQKETQATITGTREQLTTELRRMADELDGGSSSSLYVDPPTLDGNKLAVTFEVDDSEDSPPVVEFDEVPA